jgi:hypothetical protein
MAEVDLDILLNELLTDPMQLQYVRMLDLGLDQQVADKMNETGLTGESLPNARASVDESLAFLVRADVNNLSAEDMEYLNLLSASEDMVFHHPMAVTPTNPTGQTQLLNELLTMFPDTTQSGQTLRAQITQSASRSEVLFGQGTQVTVRDIGKAYRPADPTPTEPTPPPPPPETP